MSLASPGSTLEPPSPEAVRRVAVVGTGVIGGGWAAHFLARGYDVAAYDPGPQSAQHLVALVDAAWPVLTRLGLEPGADRSRLQVVGSLAQAVAGADFVQESTPENLAHKVALLAEVDRVAAPGVVIASSTSGFAMTDMAVGCATPERLVVGHPFNPPYLIPLVEVCPGERTAPETVHWAERFYRACGKAPLVMDRELPGFIGNRLQEALWREALHMVAAGEATVEQMDLSITEGPGLRWAQMGPCLTFHLAGGPGGMAHMLDHFGPALLEPWTRLAAPELTAELRERMVAGCRQEAAGRSFAELSAERDEFLADLLLLRRRHGSAGAAQPATAPPPRASTAPPPRASTAPPPRASTAPDARSAPFATPPLTVPQEWVDYNGHMADWAYAAAQARVVEAFLDALGLSAGYQAASGRTTYTVETRLRFLRQVRSGQVLTGQVLLTAVDDKRLWITSSLLDDAGEPAATAEGVYVHVDQALGRVVPFSCEQRAALAEVSRAHASAARQPGSQPPPPAAPPRPHQEATS